MRLEYGRLNDVLFTRALCSRKICPSGHSQLPSTNLLAPPHASQQTCQAPSFAGMTQVKQPQSPYQRLNGPSPGNCQMVPASAMVSQSSTGSPTTFPVNGVHTPASAMCGPQLTSPAGNFKMTVNHEDITDDEVTVKSEPRSPEDFKYNPPPPSHPPPPHPPIPVHEDITDDEAEACKPEEPPVEAKVEVKDDLSNDDDVAKAAAVTEPSNEVKTEVDETGKENSEAVEDCKNSEDAVVSKSEPAPVLEEALRGRKSRFQQFLTLSLC